VRIFEVSIRYAGRTYQEGKKIGWTDGVRAMAPILRFRFSDYFYVEDAYLREPNPRAAQPRTALHSMDGGRYPPLRRRKSLGSSAALELPHRSATLPRLRSRILTACGS
jgi:hypothetical protein